MNQENIFLPAKEISERTGINFRTIKTWISRKKIPSGLGATGRIAELNSCIKLGIASGLIKKSDLEILNRVEKKGDDVILNVSISPPKKEPTPPKKIEQKEKKAHVPLVITPAVSSEKDDFTVNRNANIEEVSAKEAKVLLTMEQHREKKLKNDLLSKNVVKWSEVKEEFHTLFSGELDAVHDLIEKILLENNINMNKREKYYAVYKSRRDNDMKDLAVSGKKRRCL